MKKYLSILLVALLCLSFAACGSYEPASAPPVAVSTNEPASEGLTRANRARSS